MIKLLDKQYQEDKMCRQKFKDLELSIIHTVQFDFQIQTSLAFFGRHLILFARYFQTPAEVNVIEHTAF